MRLTRLLDWRQRLDRYLEGAAHLPTCAGRHDCAIFAAGAVEAQTGVDFAREFRGRYRSYRQGKALIGGDHIAFAASLLPARESVLHARTGDIAIVGDALAVVAGDTLRAVHPARGLSIVPLTLANLVLAV